MNEQVGRDEGPEAPSSQGAYLVRLEAFEGPLDLLLHLVRTNEVDIGDIPIAEITVQYNAYLEAMLELDLEIAGEYLVMAATLMHIKSRMLLPAEPSADGEEEVEDPRAELVRQLVEHQRYKQAAENLGAIESSRSLVWTRDDVPAEFEGEELLAVDMFDLLRAFRGLLGRLGEEARLRITKDTVSVADKIAWLTDELRRRPSLDLLALLAGLPTRIDRIAAFLALLEMVRLRLVIAFQRRALGEIRIARGPALLVEADDGAAEPAETPVEEAP